MTSGDSGESPSNAAIAAMGGQWPGGIQLGNGEEVWGGDGQEIFLFIKYCWKAPFWSLIFLQKHMLNIGCNTPCWDLC